jgi:hypothetical protein
MFKCKENCGKCCSCIPLSKQVFEKNRQKLQTLDFEIIELRGEIIPQTKSGTCVFLDRQTKKCLIYKDRSDICKIYGTKILPCPFLLPDGSPRPAEKMKDWEDAFDKSFNDLKNKVEQKLILI